jgi:hypothetical protein
MGTATQTQVFVEPTTLGETSGLSGLEPALHWTLILNVELRSFEDLADAFGLEAERERPRDKESAFHRRITRSALWLMPMQLSATSL